MSDARLLRVGLIGTGPRERSEERGGGFAIGRVHARSWQQLPETVLVAGCDINAANLTAFAQDFGVPLTYRDYRDMLREADLDIVDICTWPPLHLEMVVAAAEAGVRGIYCEKPMTLSLGDAQRMVEVCGAHGVRLAVSHQRRFDPNYRAAKAWLSEGRIGALREIQGRIVWPDADLLSWGTHWIDMFAYFQDDCPAHSVFAQVDCTSGLKRYGHLVEDRALVSIQFMGGVRCTLESDSQPPLEAGVPATQITLRLVGEDGVIEIGETLRGIFHDGSREERPFEGNWEDAFVTAMHDLTNSIQEGREPALSGGHGLQTTEIIMAAYESANRRARVTLPLETMRFPLLDRPEFQAVR